MNELNSLSRHQQKNPKNRELSKFNTEYSQSWCSNFGAECITRNCPQICNPFLHCTEDGGNGDI